MGETLTLAIIGHLVGDYVLQNDHIAEWKKKDSAVCALHCAIWALAVMAFAGWVGFKDAGYASEHYWFNWKALLILFVAHFIQDRTNIIKFWMTRVNGQVKFAEPPMAPWSLIVVDNIFHILTIWFVWRFVVPTS